MEYFQKRERDVCYINDAERWDERHDGCPGEPWRCPSSTAVDRSVYMSNVCFQIPRSAFEDTTKPCDRYAKIGCHNTLSPFSLLSQGSMDWKWSMKYPHYELNPRITRTGYLVYAEFDRTRLRRIPLTIISHPISPFPKP